MAEDAEDAEDEVDDEAEFKGSARDMAEAMKDAATVAEFVHYDVWVADKTKKEVAGKQATTKSKLQVEKILDVADMWRSMKLMHESLSFTKLQWEEGLEELRKMKEPEKGPWTRQLTEPEAQEWLDVTSSRLRHQLRHIKQAQLRNPENPWLRKLWGTEKAADKNAEKPN